MLIFALICKHEVYSKSWPSVDIQRSNLKCLNVSSSTLSCLNTLQKWHDVIFKHTILSYMSLSVLHLVIEGLTNTKQLLNFSHN